MSAGWAEQGECTRNPKYMMGECPKSCKQQRAKIWAREKTQKREEKDKRKEQRRKKRSRQHDLLRDGGELGEGAAPKSAPRNTSVEPEEVEARRWGGGGAEAGCTVKRRCAIAGMCRGLFLRRRAAMARSVLPCRSAGEMWLLTGAPDADGFGADGRLAQIEFEIYF